MPQVLPANELTVRKMLRQATHSNHVRLNRLPLLVELSQSSLSLIAYRKLLIAYFHIYAGLEDRINQYLKQQPSVFRYAERSKLPWILTDLEFFHDDLTKLDHVMPQALVPSIERVGHLVGVLYTIEGSTLGGQVISRNLTELHGFNGIAGASFFNGYGEQTSLMWQDFLSFAESISGDAIECAAAVESACQTFQLFEQIINSISHEQRIVVLT